MNMLFPESVVTYKIIYILKFMHCCSGTCRSRLRSPYFSLTHHNLCLFINPHSYIYTDFKRYFTSVLHLNSL